MTHSCETENRFGLVVFGAGGLSLEVLQWVHDIRRNQVVSPWYLWPLALYVDNPFEAKGRAVQGLPVLSSVEGHGGHSYILATGSPEIRRKHAELAERSGLHAVYPLVHPRALLSDGTATGFGTMLCPGAVVCPDAELQEHVLLNLSATVGHRTKVGRYSVLSPGANVSGDCILGERVYVGTNAAIREKCSIADGVTIGMGAVVLHDIDEPETTWVGNPARKLVRSSGG